MENVDNIVVYHWNLTYILIEYWGAGLEAVVY